MFFRKKHAKKEQTTTTATETQKPAEEGTLNLEDMIQACDHYAGTENEEFLVTLLADSLLNGANGIQKNYALALTYYQRLSKLNPVAGQCGMGKAYIAIGLQDDDRMQFCLGVNKVYEAYVNGSDDAKSMLAFIAESGLFENVSTLDEMIRFCRQNNTVVA